MNLSMTRLAQRYDIQDVSLVIAIGVMVVVGRTSALLASQAARSWQQLLGFGIHYDNMRPVFGGVGLSPFALDCLTCLFPHPGLFVMSNPGVEFLALFWRAKFVSLTALFALIAIAIMHMTTQAKLGKRFGFTARHATAQTLGKQFGSALQHCLCRLSFDASSINVLRWFVSYFFGLVATYPALATVSVFDYGRFAERGHRFNFVADGATAQTLGKQSRSFTGPFLCNSFHLYSSANTLTLRDHITGRPK